MSNSGSELFQDRKSPLSATEPASAGSSSPNLVKHASFTNNGFPPGFITTNRPRSSSINSNGSNRSNHTRSLSIVSLESPRNSIVSIDDGFLKSSTRNNSTTSLTSMNGNLTNFNISSKPKDKEKEKLSKLKTTGINSAVLFSDEDSETDHKILKPRLKLRSRSNSTKKTALKKDFRFKFHENLKKSPGSNLPIPSIKSLTSLPQSSPIVTPNEATLSANSSQASSPTNIAVAGGVPPNLIDMTPSPLSLNIEDIKHKESAKRKPSIKLSSYSLKKNLIFSKEVRLELMSKDHDLFKTKFTNDPKKVHDKLFESDIDPDAGSSSYITNEPEDFYKHDVPNLPSDKKDDKKLPILSTLEQQHLINQMNQKWSKRPDTVMDEKQRSKRRYYSSSEEDF